MLRTQSPPTSPSPGHFDQPRHSSRRKRKADVVQDGERERLSKRLSLLRLEQSRPQTHVPAESHLPTHGTSSQSLHSQSRSGGDDDECMQVDDSKHRIFIHNIDDELSSSDSECEAGKVVFLRDIEKHLRLPNRIPRHILANEDGQLAGMQLVLYRDPKALSVPEERDGVRKAVMESRRRMRERQRQETQTQTQTQTQGGAGVDGGGDDDAMELD